MVKKFLLFFITFSAFAVEHLYEPHFVVMVASYNNRRYYRTNLDSIFKQNYPYFRVIYIDDNSPDGTADLVDEYVKENFPHGDFTLVKNPDRHLKVANFYRHAHKCEDHEIIVELDGDDWFFDENALATVAQYYRNPSVWMTYGQYIHDNMFRKFQLGKIEKVKGIKTRQLPKKVIAEGSVRSFAWVTSHMRTFYAWLYKGIKLDDLLDEKDSFFSITGDMVMAFPMIEMAGEHSCFVPEVVYVYNNHSPLNDFRTRSSAQVHAEFLVRNKMPYQRLTAPQLNSQDRFKEVPVDIIMVATNPKKLTDLLTACNQDNVQNIFVVYPQGASLPQELQNSRVRFIPAQMDDDSKVRVEVSKCLANCHDYVVLMNDLVAADRLPLIKRALYELGRTDAYAVLIHKKQDEVELDKRTSVFEDVSVMNLKNYEYENPLTSPYMILYRRDDLHENIQRSSSIDGSATYVTAGRRLGLLLK